MAILSCWRRWAPGAAGRFCRRCCCSLRPAGWCGPCCNACGPGSRCSSRWPSAPGWRWPAGVFSLAADGLAFANRLAGQDAARQRRLRVFFAAAGRGGVGRIVRPDVLRIASLHLFLHLAVAPLPEGAQIAGDLQRTLGRRQQLQHQRHPSSAITGVVASPNISCIRTASAGGFSAWYRIARRLPVGTV